MSATMTRSSDEPTVDLTPRGSTRRTRLIRLGVVLGVVALLATAAWAVGFSSLFAARIVKVGGAHQISADEVRTAAAVPLGRPLARLDTEAISRRVAAVPAVKSVTVERSWPHTVVVKVVERTPVLAVRQPGGYLLSDASGVAFRTSDEVPDGVVVTDANPDDHAILTDLSVVADAMPGKLARQVISLRATGPDDIAFTLKSGVRVSWGTAAESELKGKVVTALLKQKPRATIDVTSPHNPAIR